MDPTDRRPPNRLLEAFPQSSYELLFPSMEVVDRQQGDVLHFPGETITHLWFPLDAVVSVTVTTESGDIAEAGVVGNREVVGINALMGGRETTQTTYVVQSGGKLVRTSSTTLRSAFDTDRALRALVLRCTQAFIAQLSQNVACNRLHTVDQRYARWLLECNDRTHGNEISISQTFVSKLLGVRRPGVTAAAGRLRKRGLTDHSRGRTRITDLAGLETVACGCYRVLRDEYARLLSEGSQFLETGGNPPS